LDLSSCEYLQKDLFPRLSNLPRLVHVNLSDCKGILLEGMPELVKLTRLQSLNLNNCMQSCMGARGTWETVQVTDSASAIRLLSRSLTNLTCLSLGYWKLSKPCLVSLNLLTKLEKLSLEKWKIDISVSQNLFREMTDLQQLKILGLKGCGISSHLRIKLRTIFPNAELDLS